MSKDPFVLISGLENLPQEEQEPAQHLIEQVVQAASLPEIELSVALVDKATITQLNDSFRGKNKATDVLSFSAQEGELLPGTEQILGEVVICIEVAQKQAQELGHTFLEELAVLLSHGILHLLGLDHEKSAKEARKQAECEMAILDAAGIAPQLALSSRK